MKNKIIFLILFLVSLLSSWRLFRPGYPSMQDDIQVFRLQQFDQCLKDGQIPCRYIADGGSGYGYPLYNFYSPLPYSVAETFHLLGFSYIDSIKISFIIPAFIRTFSMYLLASTFFGTSGGVLSAALYVLAPYQAVNSFVRGAISENWALAILPLIFWSLYRQKNKISLIALSSLLLSHNLTLVYALPLLALFSLITHKFKYFFRSLLWSLALSAFFLIPAFFEKNLTTVNTMTQGYFHYIIHFTTLKELFFSNFWGYSASMWGPIDGLSFNIGLFQWLLPSVFSLYLLFHKNSKHRFLLLTFFALSLFFLFLTHSKSTLIWQAISYLPYFQFPWRFLGPVIFLFSFIGGGIVFLFPKRHSLLSALFLCLVVIAINYPYFREDIWYPQLTDSAKLSRPEIIRQSGAGLMDYWPKYSQSFPNTYAPSIPETISGQSNSINFTKNSHQASGTIDILSSSATINLPIVYFPEWKLWLDSQPSSYKLDPNLGLIQLNLPSGLHHYELKFTNTPLRIFANIISSTALLGLIILIIREKHS